MNRIVVLLAVLSSVNLGAQVIELAKKGRLVHGTTVTLLSGKTLIFGANR